jgi:ABC-type lipoprotein release transport system permease subunit
VAFGILPALRASRGDPAAGLQSGSRSSQLHGVERFDPWTIAVTCIFLIAAGLFATWLPALRVARTDPMTRLRAE